MDDDKENFQEGRENLLKELTLSHAYKNYTILFLLKNLFTLRKFISLRK